MNKKGFIEILAILFMSFIFLVIGYSIYKEIDFGIKQGVVIDKKYQSSWVSYTSSYVNASTISIPVTHPQSWSIRIQKDDKDLWIEVSEYEYNQIKIGDCYQCKKGD